MHSLICRNPNQTSSIVNTSQYSSPEWKALLNETTYLNTYNDSNFELNKLVNPEVGKRKHNIQLTPISEYSNAQHNKTVFKNPKYTACWSSVYYTYIPSYIFIDGDDPGSLPA